MLESILHFRILLHSTLGDFQTGIVYVLHARHCMVAAMYDVHGDSKISISWLHCIIVQYGIRMNDNLKNY